MKTDGGWVSISEAARLYGKSRKWVSNQISAYDIETRKEGNQTRFRLVDLIAQWARIGIYSPDFTSKHTEKEAISITR